MWDALEPKQIIFSPKFCNPRATGLIVSESYSPSQNVPPLEKSRGRLLKRTRYYVVRDVELSGWAASDTYEREISMTQKTPHRFSSSYSPCALNGYLEHEMINLEKFKYQRTWWELWSWSLNWTETQVIYWALY